MRRRQCVRTQFLRSNVLLPIPEHTRTCAHLTRLCVRAHAPVPNKQCSSAFERTSLAFERTSRVCYILRGCDRSSFLRLSAPQLLQQQTRRSVYVMFSVFYCCFIFSFYLFILPMFIYFLAVFSFC
jgi:hypothetical protein